MKTTSILYCMLLLIAVSLFTTPAKAQVNVNDSLVLVELYNSTDGPEWTYNYNWLTEKPVSSWYGVTVTDSRVTGLHLVRNRLNGSIPSSIGNLVNLEQLWLRFNQLSGAIPASIGNLVKLRHLNLSFNQLSGTIPAALGNCVSLTELHLGNNQLSGSIPAEIGNLVKLYNLYLYNNQLSGAIPSSIGNLSKLFVLSLPDNHLSGAIPAEIGNCTNLGGLDLSSNRLSGAIPPSIGNLANLNDLWLSHNRLSGVIPVEISKLVNLRYLYLSNNQLSGSVVSALRGPWRLYRVDLSYNQLSQVGNISFSKDTFYQSGYVNNNLFTFDGLEFIAKNFSNTYYAPQANIPVHQQGNILSVYAGGTLSNNTYKWHQVGTTDSTVIKADSTFTPSQSGMYYVTVTNLVATQLNLYSDTIDFTLSPVKQGNNLPIAKRLQPATIIQHMLVYPNPAKEVVHVQVKGTATITIADANGKILLSKSINNSEIVNVSALAPGTYYLQNKTTGEVQKIVVVH